MRLDKQKNFILTFAALIIFFIVLFFKEIDPLWLGLGLAILLTPAAVANVFEHLTDAGEEEPDKKLSGGDFYDPTKTRIF